MKGGFVAVVLALTLSVSHSAFAQFGNASVGGFVQDATGAYIPGVTITATNTQTAVATTAITNESGAYTILSLLPGTYRLAAELPGFKSQVFNDVQLGGSDIRAQVARATVAGGIAEAHAFDAEHWQALSAHFLQLMAEHHQKNPDEIGLDGARARRMFLHRLPTPAFNELIQSLFKAGQLARSGTSFKTSEEHYDYAVALMNQGDYDDARSHLEKILKQNSKADFAIYGLAVLDCLQGRVEDALRRGGRRNRESAPSCPPSACGPPGIPGYVS